MKGGETVNKAQQYREELLSSQNNYKRKCLLERINVDKKHTKELVTKIEELFRRDYIVGEEIVTVHIIPKVSYPVFGYNLVEQTYSTELPHYLLLMVRYELAKEYGIVFNGLRLTHLFGSYNPQAKEVKIPAHEITLKLF